MPMVGGLSDRSFGRSQGAQHLPQFAEQNNSQQRPKAKATSDSQESNNKAKRKSADVSTQAKEASRSVIISLNTNWRAVVVDASNKQIQTIENNPPCRYRIRDDSLVGELERLISKIIPKEAADEL